MFSFGFYSIEERIRQVTHYFTDNRNLKQNRKEHSFRLNQHEFTFVTDNGVFSKTGVDYGTMVLLEQALEEEWHGNIVDMGCGYGPISIAMKYFYPERSVTGVDVNLRALELCTLNSELNKVHINVLESNGYEKVQGTFDGILTNPPIRTGKKIIYSMFKDAHTHLSTGGKMLVVIRKQQGAESAKKELEEIFGNCEIARKDRGYWILRCIK